MSTQQEGNTCKCLRESIYLGINPEGYEEYLCSDCFEDMSEIAVDPEKLGALKVIVRSNESEPHVVGHLMGFRLGLGTRIPVVYTEKGGYLICFGITIPYTEEMDSLLTDIPFDRQWKMMEKTFGGYTELRGKILTAKTLARIYK